MTGLACGGCGKFTPGERFADGCLACWAVARTPEIAERFAGPAPAVPVVRDVEPTKLALPCVHEGARLTPAELAANGLGPSRKWQWCKAGKTKNPGGIPGIVCPCSGCGPRCAGYEGKQ